MKIITGLLIIYKITNVEGLTLKIQTVYIILKLERVKTYF